MLLPTAAAASPSSSTDNRPADRPTTTDCRTHNASTANNWSDSLRCNVCTHSQTDLVPVFVFYRSRWNSLNRCHCSVAVATATAAPSSSHIQMFTLHTSSTTQNSKCAEQTYTWIKNYNLRRTRTTYVHTTTTSNYYVVSKCTATHTLWCWREGSAEWWNNESKRIYFIEYEMLLKFESSCGCTAQPSSTQPVQNVNHPRHNPQSWCQSSRNCWSRKWKHSLVAAISRQTCIHYIIDLFFSTYKLHCQFQRAPATVTGDNNGCVLVSEWVSVWVNVIAIGATTAQFLFRRWIDVCDAETTEQRFLDDSLFHSLIFSAFLSLAQASMRLLWQCNLRTRLLCE